MKPTYSLVVPVYESSDSVNELADRVHKLFEVELKSSYELILVDDGSRSTDTKNTLVKLAKQRSNIKVISLMKNYGKPSAVLCGLRYTQGDYVITIDDDLQQNPEDIPLLLEYESHDVVVANFEFKYHGKLQKLTSWIKSLFDKYVVGVPCKMSPLKLIQSNVVKKMLTVSQTYPYIPAMIATVTSDIFPVTVPHNMSYHGDSRYNFARRFKQFSNLLIGNSNFLFRYIGLFGIALFLLGVLGILFVLIDSIFFDSLVKGWMKLLIGMIVLSGFLISVLSIIGEYLHRILRTVNNKPSYFIREIINKD